MCGVAGIFAPHIQGNLDFRQACLRMLQKLEHRGPDGKGLYEDEHLILGHTRLAVIDLSKAADQPISNESETIWLSFNGEIYNFRLLREQLIRKGHRFRSNTDSEVIVHLYEEYGTACLDHLNGMFTFALWDGGSKQLFLARDRFGIKPLYYAETSRAFVFASEVQALLASGLVPNATNNKAFLQFLQYGSIPSPATSFEHVFCLPAGHYLLKDAARISIRPYWSLAECFGKGGLLDNCNETDKIREHLCRIMKNHLVSDVPLAILLSGGMDSSSLVAASREVSGNTLHTLTIAFEGEEHDESSFARIVSNTFGTEHHERLIASEDFVGSLDAFIRALDQPTIDGFNTFTIAEIAKEMGFRVLISGLGGDEVFGGYAHFQKLKFLFQVRAMYTSMPKVIREVVLMGLAKAARLMGLSSMERFGYLKDPSEASVYRVYRGIFPPSLIQELTHSRFQDLSLALGSHQNLLLSELDSAFYFEFSHYLHNQLLRDTDVMSMHHSIEMRVPYLDHELVSTVLGLPAKKRFDPRQPKALLKKALQPFLPDAILRRKKRGFIFPLGDWMRTSLKPKIEEVLMSPSTLPMGLNSKDVRKVWMLFLKGRLHWSLPWALYIFKRWQEEKLVPNQLVRAV